MLRLKGLARTTLNLLRGASCLCKRDKEKENLTELERSRCHFGAVFIYSFYELSKWGRWDL